MPVHSHDLGRKLCDLWGIDSSKVTNMVLQFEVGEPVVLTIEYYPSHEDMMLAIEELKHFVLTEQSTEE